MSAVPHFTEERIAELCDLATVTDWLERAWRDLGAGEAATTLRVRAAAGGLMGSAMAASWPRHRVVGGKLYLTHPDGFAFLVGLFSPDVGLVATFDGLGLTAIRTAAATALAVRHLAPPGAGTAAVFGTGTQSRPHLEALAQELPLQDLRVWGRSVDKAEEVAAWGRDRGIPARAVANADEAVTEAAVVATVTSSYTPVFDGTLLDPAALVCAVGSTKADRREVDGATVQRAAFVVSDSAEGARTEAGRPDSRRRRRHLRLGRPGRPRRRDRGHGDAAAARQRDHAVRVPGRGIAGRGDSHPGPPALRAPVGFSP